MRMEKRKYELTTTGINCALIDYLRNNKDTLFLNNTTGENPCIVSVPFVNIQEKFRGKGLYKFRGDAMIRTTNKEGVISEDSKAISGFVQISIDCNGELYVEKVDEPISLISNV